MVGFKSCFLALLLMSAMIILTIIPAMGCKINWDLCDTDDQCCSKKCIQYDKPVKYGVCKAN